MENKYHTRATYAARRLGVNMGSLGQAIGRLPPKVIEHGALEAAKRKHDNLSDLAADLLLDHYNRTHKA